MRQWLDIRTLMISGMILIPAMLAAGYSGSILLVFGLGWLALLGVLHFMVGHQDSDQALPSQLSPNSKLKAPAHPGVEAILSDRVILERTTTAILDDFVNCDLDQIEEDMKRVLSRLGSFIGAKRCYLYTFGARNQECSLWLAWTATGFDDVPVPPDSLSVDAATRIYKIFERDPVVLINQVSQPIHPIAAHLPWSQEGESVGSCGAARILNDGKNLGFLGFDVDAVSHWGNDEKNLLQIVANQFNTLFSRLEARQSQIEAIEALKASNRAKSEFLANMSHEIRTPLNGVIGIADLLRETNLTQHQLEYAEIISNSGSTLMNLVSGILDMSKIEAGELELDPVETNLHTLVEDLISVTAFNAQRQGLEMVCRLAPGMSKLILVDPGRLRQVLTNLLNNAVKFTQEGHIFLDVEPVDELGESCELRFRVSDTGIGISQDHVDRIFEKFTQADGSSTRRFGGTGLGLSICRHLVGLMGGRIGAKGVLGEGSTFSFTIPLKQLAPAEPAPTPETAYQILLASGHGLTGNVLAEQIRHLGHHCTVTHDISEAEKWLATGPSESEDKWDAVILDPSNLKGNAYFIYAQIDDFPAERRPQVFLLTQLADKPVDRERWSKYVAGVLPKPVRMGRITTMLNGIAGAGLDVIEGNGGQGKSSHDSDEQKLNPRQKVLLAEDNLFNQKVACGMLEQLGCEVSVASDGIEALALAGKEEFDLIFMDCQMPRMDGFEASRRIRELSGTQAGIPIIALTANALGEARDACLAAGMDDFMTKPVKKDQLEETLNKWVSILNCNP